MPPCESKNEWIGVVIAGRYRIISRLGTGGMADAYRAWDARSGVPVVIKIPRPLLLEDPRFAERFQREIRLLKQLAHPHIVPIHDAGEHEGSPYVVMRFLPGGTLANRQLRDEHSKPLPNPPGMLHLWLPAVAEALDHAHARGVIHRDVKPANIFFDGLWTAYLGDFGIAKIVAESVLPDDDQPLTRTQMGIGTPDYMAPEQFGNGQPIDGRADQYALAVMVYEIVAGIRPFRGEMAKVIVEVLTQPAPSLAAAHPGVPPTLFAAVHRGLAKLPEDRFSSCQAFAAAALGGVPQLTGEREVARLLCPQCAAMLKLPLTAGGRTGTCPKCRSAMAVAQDLGALLLLGESGPPQSTSGPELDHEVDWVTLDEDVRDIFAFPDPHVSRGLGRRMVSALRRFVRGLGGG